MLLNYDLGGQKAVPIVPTALIAVAASYVLFVVGRGIYNITFHPLAKYPGPKFRAAFRIGDALTALNGDRDKQIVAYHEKYGHAVRLGPNYLSFTSAQAWKDIYGFRPGKHQLQKDPEFYGSVALEGFPPSIFDADDAHHSAGRRVLANAFSDNALRGQEEILNIYFDLLVTKLYEVVDGNGQGKTDIVSWYNFTTFDIIGDLTFGESFHALESGDYHPWIRNIFQVAKTVRWLRLANIYSLVNVLLQLADRTFPGVRRTRKMQEELIFNRVNKRLSLQTERKDFITFITNPKNGSPMTYNEIVPNAQLLLIGGSETTATTLSGVTYNLLRNPDKLARLQNEVRSAFSSASEMTLVNVGRLPYLQAVLEEGLRMYPPLPTLLPRLIPPEGAMVDGQHVAGGTAVGVHQLATYRSPLNWTDPNDFVPERWLHGDAAPERYRGDQRDALQPFSTGPRNCLGKNLAYNELRAILARVVWHFEMELLPESIGWTDQKSWLFWEKPPLNVRLSRRHIEGEKPTMA